MVGAHIGLVVVLAGPQTNLKGLRAAITRAALVHAPCCFVFVFLTNQVEIVPAYHLLRVVIVAADCVADKGDFAVAIEAIDDIRYDRNDGIQPGFALLKFRVLVFQFSLVGLQPTVLLCHARQQPRIVDRRPQLISHLP